MKRTELWLLVRRFVCIVAVLTLIPALMVIFQFARIHSLALWVGIALYVLLVLTMTFIACSKGIRRRWILTLGVVVALLLSAANITLYVVGQSAGNFLSSLSRPQTTYVEYSIIAQKEHQVALDTARSAAMISDDPTYEAAAQGLAGETAAQVERRDNLTQLVDTVTNESTDIAALRSANLTLVEENAPELFEQLVVLGTFWVKAPEQNDTQTIDATKPFVVYVSGMDTYGDLSNPSRSDVNMLLVVNPAKRQLLTVNTPRDYYVQLHGTTGTRDKLTHAGVYGVDTSRQTMADLYDLEIPAYVRVNFTSLVRIIDTIGPIEVYSPHNFKDFSKGINTLDSEAALEFARERYSFADGDRERGRNQQRVIEAIIARLSEPKNIVHYNTVLKKLQGSLQTDISNDSVMKLVNMQLNDLKRWQVESISVNGTGAMEPTYSMGAQPLYVMIPDRQSVDLAKQKIVSTLEE